MSDITTLMMGAAGGGEVDPYFNQTTLLLHGDGTNGAQNDTFLDSSTNNFTITRNGNTTQGTFSPFSAPDGRWSNYFDGTGDYLQVSDATLALGTGDFSIQFWVYNIAFDGSSGINVLIDYRNGSDPVISPVIFTTNGQLFFRVNGSNVISGSTLNLNEWYFIGISRASGTTKMFVNGVQVGSDYSDTNNYTSSVIRIGADHDGNLNQELNGYMSGLKITQGAAVDFSALGVPTTPPTADANTELLTCQSNRFKDNSTNNFAITPAGNVAVQPFSPFAPSAAYDSSVNGGSGYFDGSGDYLSVPSDADFAMGTGDFTVECWINPSTVSGSELPVFKIYAALAIIELRQINNTISMQFRGANAVTSILTSSAGTIAVGTWHHLAFVRDSGTLRAFLNGVEYATATNTENHTAASLTITVGANQTPSVYFNGYISSLRVIKGTALYTSGFTPPTAPLTAISGTSLLTNFTNAGIFDNTGKNNLETIADCAINTTTKKYGTGSMEFDGTGDELLAVTNQENFNFNSGNFTIEMWVKLNSATNTVILSQASGTGAANTNWVLAMVSNVAQFALSDGSSYFVTLNATTNITNGNWYHIAAVRNGSSVNLYVNGTSEASATSSTAIASTLRPLRIGSNTSSYFNGFIDDLRITKGVARYTTTFTPPTKAFPDL